MILTSWGYSLPDAISLPELITETEFNSYTANRYAGDSRITPGITAASLALRNYCGWHIGGSYKCAIKWNIKNRGIVRSGADLLVQLPARFVESVLTVKIDGEATTDFFAETSGLLTIYNAYAKSRKSILEVEYVAGADLGAIKQLVADMVTLGLAKSYGVTSEAAGGVSITYNASWTNGSFDSVIENNKGMLNAYRLEGVF